MALEHLGWNEVVARALVRIEREGRLRLLRLGERREKITRGGGHHLDGLPALERLQGHRSAEAEDDGQQRDSGSVHRFLLIGSSRHHLCIDGLGPNDALLPPGNPTSVRGEYPDVHRWRDTGCPDTPMVSRRASAGERGRGRGPGPSHAPPPPCAGGNRGGPGAPDVRNRGSHAAPAGRQDGVAPSNRGRAVTRRQRGMPLGRGRTSDSCNDGPWARSGWRFPCRSRRRDLPNGPVGGPWRHGMPRGPATPDIPSGGASPSLTRTRGRADGPGRYGTEGSTPQSRRRLQPAAPTPGKSAGAAAPQHGAETPAKTAELG